ncbi:hypothetical protein PSPO01_09722 [Paraphaeosphaeria sporulosa]
MPELQPQIQRLLNLSIACALISTFSIVIRIYCKVRNKGGFHTGCLFKKESSWDADN